MVARPVQISIDEGLLERIDADPEVKARGRSAFVREACEVYLRVRRRRAVDEAIGAAYGASADKMLDEVEGMIEEQAWPKE